MGPLKVCAENLIHYVHQRHSIKLTLQQIILLQSQLYTVSLLFFLRSNASAVEFTLELVVVHHNKWYLRIKRGETLFLVDWKWEKCGNNPVKVRNGLTWAETIKTTEIYSFYWKLISDYIKAHLFLSDKKTPERLLSAPCRCSCIDLFCILIPLTTSKCSNFTARRIKRLLNNWLTKESQLNRIRWKHLWSNWPQSRLKVET